MTQIFKQGIFILICVHYYCHCYNNFNELKIDMQLRVTRVADAALSIYSDICSVGVFQCPVKSFNVCDGTDTRTCIQQFPVTSQCLGVSQYSMTSGIRIPNSVASFNLSDPMKFFICKTAEPQFESVLQQLIKQNNRQYGWISFGSNLGVSRISPGFKFEKQNTTQSCEEFDPRLRPWFAQNIYGRKKMIIIIQNSKAIYDQPNRFTSMQSSLSAVLNSASPDDLFNVIQFSDSPRLFFGPNDKKLVSLSSLYNQYNKVVSSNSAFDFYEAVANNITKSKSTVGNYIAALQLALEVFTNSDSMNPEMENLILFFAGFKPTNYTSNYSIDMATMLSAKEQQLGTNFFFFGFGVTLLDQQGVKILSSLACKYDGIYTYLNDVTYASMFLDQAAGYYDYLTQGNIIDGTRWTELYEDALGLGKMVTVIKPCYRQEGDVTKLIGVASIDIMLKQLTAFLSMNDISKNLQITKLPFKKNVSICSLQNIRRDYRCHNPDVINCTRTQFCSPSIQPSNATVIQASVDTSSDNCCIDELQNKTGMIVGIILGVAGAVFLIAIGVYCLIFRKRKKNDLQQTYAEIFAQFHDFDKTRIRSDSEISVINS